MRFCVSVTHIKRKVGGNSRGGRGRKSCGKRMGSEFTKLSSLGNSRWASTEKDTEEPCGGALGGESSGTRSVGQELHSMTAGALRETWSPTDL